MGQALRLAELVATFALGQDSSFGQPMDSQLRSCLIALRIADSLRVSDEERDTVYWVAQLRYIGCTGHAHEVAAVFGDEIELRARSLVNDLTDPREVIGEIFRNVGKEHNGARRGLDILSMLAGGKKYMEMNFRTGCEVGDKLAERLGMSQAVRHSLQFTFERWNGKGLPNGAKGTAIPLPMRIVHLSQDVEAIGRISGHDAAFAAVQRRRGKLYDPAVVDAFLPALLDTLTELDKLDPWDAALEAEPKPRRTLTGSALDEALTIAADFIDLKSPYTAGHSRGVALLAEEAAKALGVDAEAIRRAALVHDFGRTAIPNSIWDKSAPLTRAEVDRIQLHPLLTEQMLRRCDVLKDISSLAASHHEKVDGSGYCKGSSGNALSPAARILSAADCYQDLIEDRAYRPALSRDQAAKQLRERVRQGRLDAAAAEAVLSAAGHASTRKHSPYPDGLTEREVEVLRLAAQGLTTKQIAARLVISAKTADHHIQHIYGKSGVSTRGALALYAIERGLATL